MTRYLTLCFSLLLVACGGPDDTGHAAPEMPRFADETLAKGRAVWMGTCRNCHLLGVSGAPAVSDSMAWESRIGKGVEVLYQSALQGIRGEDGNYRMPPRGGNSQLKDEQVYQAVDYMVASVRELSGR